MVETKTPEENVVLEEALEVLEEQESPEAEEKNKEQELTENLQRLQAEFQNFQRRTEKEKVEIKANANESLISEILPIMDNFELALKHSEDKGVAIIYDEMKRILEKQGLKKIDTKGTFDPKFHEALIQVEGKKQGEIVEELQKGYLLNGKLLRASKVKITTSTKK